MKFEDKPRYYCWDFPKIECCGSCHSEWEDGYGEPFEEDCDDFVFLSRVQRENPPQKK